MTADVIPKSEGAALGARMAAFALTFPSMRYASGVKPWDAERLDAWADGSRSHGELVTARFLLTVWDPATDWKCGRFDLMDALRVWDPTHHAVFLRWAREPWWP
ncbi:MAG: hypothetical protein U0790_03785 [Isosphaeraceae bacterium]